MNEVQVYEDLPQHQTPNQLIALALEKGADPATLEKLMDLQERWEAGNARKAYTAAMSGFKIEAPAIIAKNDQVDFTTAKGRTHYNYANLGSIVQEITALMGKYSLSASWETKQDERDNIIVTCHITHAAGHRESVTLRGPADDSGNKNRIQAVGSTVTYLQRYTLLAVLGLATAEDPDGMPEPRTPIQQPQAKTNGKPEPLTVRGNIEDVTVKTGTGPKGAWTKYGVKIAGQVYGSFDSKIGELAQEGNEVVVSYTSDGRFNTIVELVPVKRAE